MLVKSINILTLHITQSRVNKLFDKCFHLSKLAFFPFLQNLVSLKSGQQKAKASTVKHPSIQQDRYINNDRFKVSKFKSNKMRKCIF